MALTSREDNLWLYMEMTISMSLLNGEDPREICSVTKCLGLKYKWAVTQQQFKLHTHVGSSYLPRISLAQPFCLLPLDVWRVNEKNAQNLTSTAVLLRGLGYTLEDMWLKILFNLINRILGSSHCRIGATIPDTAINLGSNWSVLHKYISHRFTKHKRKKSNLYSYCGNGVNGFEPVSFNLM